MPRRRLSAPISGCQLLEKKKTIESSQAARSEGRKELLFLFVMLVSIREASCLCSGDADRNKGTTFATPTSLIIFPLASSVFAVKTLSDTVDLRHEAERTVADGNLGHDGCCQGLNCVIGRRE